MRRRVSSRRRRLASIYQHRRASSHPPCVSAHRRKRSGAGAGASYRCRSAATESGGAVGAESGRDVPEGRIARVPRWAISAQRPPTAHGMGFLVLEDETGRLPVALPPPLATQLHRLQRDARVVVVMGRVERVRWYRSLLGAALHAAG
jgi:hypothetical protein